MRHALLMAMADRRFGDPGIVSADREIEIGIFGDPSEISWADWRIWIDCVIALLNVDETHDDVDDVGGGCDLSWTYWTTFDVVDLPESDCPGFSSVS